MEFKPKEHKSILKLTYVLHDIILKSLSHFIVLLEDAESPSFH